jgi:hypothetical protein
MQSREFMPQAEWLTAASLSSTRGKKIFMLSAMLQYAV